MLQISFDHPSQEELSDGLIPLLHESIKQFGDIDLGYTWSEHLPTETFATFHCYDGESRLFSFTEGGQPFVVNEPILSTLVNGFLQISEELLAGQTTVVHMFLEGSGDLIVEVMNSNYVRITYDSYHGKRTLEDIPLETWHRAVARLGYTIINFYDQNAAGIRTTQPFVDLHIRLQKVELASGEIGVFS